MESKVKFVVFFVDMKHDPIRDSYTVIQTCFVIRYTPTPYLTNHTSYIALSMVTRYGFPVQLWPKYFSQIQKKYINNNT